MTAYLLRRLFLMIPTFIGILIINFGVMRLQGTTLTEALSEGGGGKGAQGSETGGTERKVQGASRRYENYLDRFRRTGNDLPALVNLRGFWTKADVVADLRYAAPDSSARDSARNQMEKALWLAGPMAVPPLAEVLADDALVDLHPAVSQALVLCADTTIETQDLDRLPQARLNQIQQRNADLRDLVIQGATERGKPGSPTDPEYAKKRVSLLAICRDPANAADYTQKHRWGAILGQTGFCDFITRLVTGNLYSETKKRYVFDLIGERWQVTFWLNTLSIVIAWAIAIPLGIRSAQRAGSLEDKTTTQLMFALWSLPSFFVGTLLLHHFCTSEAGKPAWFPNAGLSSPDNLWLSTPAYLLDLAWHAALPLLVLSYASFVSLSRYLRGNLLEQLGADYTRTARAKGCDERQVLYGHAFRNSSLTLITLSAGLLSELFGGVLIVEMIFSINGLGQLLVDAAIQQDAPLVMGSTVIQVGLLLVGILIADLLYAMVDPRLRSKYA